MTHDDRTVLTSAQELVQHLEPTGIVFYELSAQYDDSVELPKGEVDLELEFGTSLRIRARGVDYRFRVEVPLLTGAVVVDAAIQYEASEDLAFHRDALREFGQRAAVMSLYPYVRQAVSDLMGRLRVPTVFLPMLTPGEVTFDVDRLPEVVGAVESDEPDAGVAEPEGSS